MCDTTAESNALINMPCMKNKREMRNSFAVSNFPQLHFVVSCGSLKVMSTSIYSFSSSSSSQTQKKNVITLLFVFLTFKKAKLAHLLQIAYVCSSLHLLSHMKLRHLLPSVSSSFSFSK